MEDRRIEVSTLDRIFRRGLSWAVTLIWHKGREETSQDRTQQKAIPAEGTIMPKHYVGSKFSGQGPERKINHNELWGHRK